MKLVLARHGNTFGPGDTPVWVGAKEDLPLVEKGQQQSLDAGHYLVRHDLQPDLIICGPLKRTLEGAAIISSLTGYEPSQIVVDDRLREIDYGSWGGKSDAEIEARFGAKVIEDWRERSIVPAEADWSPKPDNLRAHARAVLEDVLASGEETVLLISSNGILRFYHDIFYANISDPPSSKVKTGHICLANWTGKTFEPVLWNYNPVADI